MILEYACTCKICKKEYSVLCYSSTGSERKYCKTCLKRLHSENRGSYFSNKSRDTICEFQCDEPLSNLELAEFVASRARISTEDMLTIIEGLESGYNLKDNPIYAIASRDRKIKELQSILDEEAAARESRHLAATCRDGSDKEHRNNDDENLALYANIIESVTKESSDIVAKALKTILTGVVKHPASVTKSDYLLSELASEWNSFSSEKKLSIATSVSGRYQTARFIVLIDELSKIHDSET